MSVTVKALVVAGGGGGGATSNSSYKPGGGGAGGLVYSESVVITSGETVVTVGPGGAGSPDVYGNGLSGGNSSFAGITAIGGGGGGSRYTPNGNSGGSGGGGNGDTSLGTGGSATSGQGYAGGSGNSTYGAGGGGAGGAGSAALSGGGGAGLANSISGASVTYAAGGASFESGADGAANTGNGGGGDNAGQAGDGGSGVVIIRYTTNSLGNCTGGTITYDGSDTIHTFTSSGTFSVTFVETEATTDIAYDTATANATVYAGAGTAAIVERGVVWSTSTAPTTSNSKTVVSGTTGAFTASMTGLTPNTLYYVRGYVTDANSLTTYGNEVTFTTLAVPANTLAKDISGVEGATYAVRLYVGGTTGTLTVKIGSTGYSETFNAGAGYVTLQGEYSGLIGLMFEASGTFNGYIDDVQYVLVLGTAVIDWDLTTLTNVLPINSSVVFKRLEDADFNKFRVIRYLDVQFKDLDAYVTLLVKRESNENVSQSTKEFLISNESATTLPFVKKRISTLIKDQATLIGVSNNRLSETFTICQIIMKGTEMGERAFDGAKIINVV